MPLNLYKLNLYAIKGKFDYSIECANHRNNAEQV